MKLGIYGDSYADSLHSIKYNPDISYIELLTKEYGKLNFRARGGSSVYYSFDQFIKTHSQNDRNIFIKTVSNRLWIDRKTKDYRNGIHISCLDSALSISQSTDVEAKQIGEAAAQFFLHLMDFKKEQLVDSLFIDKILTIRPDTIIIDATQFGFGKDCDWDFYSIDQSTFHHTYRDLRHCHLSTEKHLILFEMLQDCIENNRNEIDHSRLMNVRPSKPLEKAFTTDATYHTITYEDYFTERFLSK